MAVLKAKVRAGKDKSPVQAFGGHEFVQYEWRRVPEGFEQQAREHPLLVVNLNPPKEPDQIASEKATKDAIEQNKSKASKKATKGTDDQQDKSRDPTQDAGSGPDKLGSTDHGPKKVGAGGDK